jgi:dihydrofolate reductase
MSITLIAAVADNGCIGKNGGLPWYLPEDLKRFKRLTVGKVVVMGRKTWESLPEKVRPLPERTNVVITRQTEYELPGGVERFDSLEAALTAHKNDEVVIMGGAEVYRQAFPSATNLELTRVHQTIEGDVFFPTMDEAAWKETAREDFDGYSFVSYQRV